MLTRSHSLTACPSWWRAALRTGKVCCFLYGCLIVGVLPLAAQPPQRMAQQLPPSMDDAEELPDTLELPDRVRVMPKINAELEVVHRRSQVIVFKGRVARVHVTDPSVADYVLYSPTELGVIGTSIGTTTILVWFEDEDNTDPLIYLVTVTRDPGLEESARIDYGRLEKKLAILFPNSKVYLIPMSTKIIVKGQARDSEEAAWILQIIRGEVINQLGGLAGPQYALGLGGGAGAATAVGTGAGWGGGGLGGAGLGGGGMNGRFNAFDNTSNWIINMMTIPGEFQINLRVRIVELNRSQLRRMGVNLSVLFANGRDMISSSLAGAISGGAAGGAAGGLQGVFEAGDISILINALRSNGTARILTEPNLTVLSGHDATVLSGGEFAVPTIVGINGVGGQQTVFRGFGVSMLVTPTIIDKDMIRMRIRPEYSELSGQSSGGIPGLSTRRVDTTVQLREGQTIVLAGLLSYRARTQVAGLPFLGGLPLIGPLLFQAKQATEDENELMIMVSPEIVRPMDADDVPPVPGFEVTQPNDKMLYHYGFTQGNNDPNVYQLAPYGHGSGVGVPIGYGQFNPQPSSPSYTPAPGGVGAGGASNGMPGVAPSWDTSAGSRYPAGPAQQGGRPGMPQNNYAPPPGYAPPGGMNGQPGYNAPGPTANRTSVQSDPPRRLLTIPQMLRGGGGQATQTQATQTGYATQQGGRYR
ncbi:MAG: type and secretion system protein [Planctomycetaceae bacterium]|nr:type and secretion system protein [Planctomycetaceae bacterium]